VCGRALPPPLMQAILQAPPCIVLYHSPLPPGPMLASPQAWSARGPRVLYPDRGSEARKDASR
jgi:hypothetical protein